MKNFERYSIYRRGYSVAVDSFFRKPNTPPVATAVWAAIFPEVERICRNKERKEAVNDGFYRYDFYVTDPDGKLVEEFAECRRENAIIGNWNYTYPVAVCLIVDNQRMVWAKGVNTNDATTCFRPLTEIRNYDQIETFRSKQRVAEVILRQVTASTDRSPHFHVCAIEVANMLVTIAQGRPRTPTPEEQVALSKQALS